MYCKNCGAQISDESLYCCQCGQKQTKETNKNEEQQPKNQKQNSQGCLWWFCIVTITILLLAILISLITGLTQYSQKDNSQKEETKEETQKEETQKEETKQETTTELKYLTKYDLNIDSIWNMDNSQLIIIITPYLDTQRAKFNFTFYNKQNEIIFEATKEIPTLQANIQHTIVVSFVEISDKKHTINNVQWQITDGIASYEVNQ